MTAIFAEPWFFLLFRQGVGVDDGGEGGVPRRSLERQFGARESEQVLLLLRWRVPKLDFRGGRLA